MWNPTALLCFQNETNRASKFHKNVLNKGKALQYLKSL